MIDAVGLRVVIVALAGWVNRHQLEVIEYLREENRVLKEHLDGRRLRLTDVQRRRLAVNGHRLGRKALREVATLVTPDTILRWHRPLIARQWTSQRRCVGRPGVLREIRQLTIQMAREHPTWGYRRIQGALTNLGHRVARSTVATILQADGIGPVPERPMSWRTSWRSAFAPARARGLKPILPLGQATVRVRARGHDGSIEFPDSTAEVQERTGRGRQFVGTRRLSSSNQLSTTRI